MADDELRAALNALIDVTAQNAAAVMKLELDLAKVSGAVLLLAQVQLQQAELLRIHHEKIQELEGDSN